MSRIHEALQRAYLERGKVPVLEDIRIADPELDSVLSVPPSTKVEVAIADIKRQAWKPNRASLPTLSDRGAGVEQFRGLRSHIYQARQEAPLKTILIASGMPGEGKSFVASNLAISMARNSIHTILLIDGDLRRPSLHTLLGAPNEIGLTNYLEGTATVAEILQRDKEPEAGGNAAGGDFSNLTLISAGRNTDHSSELVANHRLKDLIEAVSPHFDWIVIDAPPVLAVSDAVDLAQAADAILLVARGAATPYEVAQRTKAAFTSSRILGYVLNDMKDAPRTGPYHYTYNYYYHRGDSGPKEQSKRGKENGR